MSSEDYIEKYSFQDDNDHIWVTMEDALEAVRMIREESRIKGELIIKKDERIKVLEDTMVEIERLLKMITDEI